MKTNSSIDLTPLPYSIPSIFVNYKAADDITRISRSCGVSSFPQNNMAKYLLHILPLLFLLGLVFVLPVVAPFDNSFLVIRATLILLAMMELLRLLKDLFYDKGISEKPKTYTMLMGLLLICLFLFEVIFMFVPRSHNVGYTYGNNIWFKKYWRENSYGFRDDEPTPYTSAILFVGDSFTAGYGIKNEDDRISNLVCQDLNDIRCINLGLNGGDTEEEFQAMIDFIEKTNVQATTIVLQYFGNDIDKTALQHGLTFGGFEPYKEMNAFNRFFIKGSYLINYVYWLFPHGDTKSYFEFLEAAYADSTIFKQHLNSLDKFIHYAAQYDIELIVSVFPFMQDPGTSQALYVDEINSYLFEKGVRSLDVGKYLNDLPKRDWVVNNNDGHASAKVHKIVAEQLRKMIRLNKKLRQ